MIPLDIHADPVCPFCYLGWGALAAALARRPDHPFAVAWHPFRLNPQIPPGGLDRRSYLEGLFGSKEKAAAAHVPIVRMAAELGLPLALEKIERTPDTTDAHRLVHWAGLEGRASTAMEALMTAYWAEGRDIGEPVALAGIAQSVGMDGAMVLRLLATDADRAELAAREAAARDRGIRAVPTFIVAGTHAVQGAQPVRLWHDVIADLAGPRPPTRH